MKAALVLIAFALHTTACAPVRLSTDPAPLSKTLASKVAQLAQGAGEVRVHQSQVVLFLEQRPFVVAQPPPTHADCTRTLGLDEHHAFWLFSSPDQTLPSYGLQLTDGGSLRWVGYDVEQECVVDWPWARPEHDEHLVTIPTDSAEPTILRRLEIELLERFPGFETITVGERGFTLETSEGQELGRVLIPDIAIPDMHAITAGPEFYQQHQDITTSAQLSITRHQGGTYKLGFSVQHNRPDFEWLQMDGYVLDTEGQLELESTLYQKEEMGARPLNSIRKRLGHIRHHHTAYGELRFDDHRPAQITESREGCEITTTTRSLHWTFTDLEGNSTTLIEAEEVSTDADPHGCAPQHEAP